MRLSYGDSTDLFRINLGWSNQRGNQPAGFNLDLERGYWSRNQADDEDIDDAIAHIERFGTQHTDAIVTQDQAAAEQFLARVDSAIVLHNASTQFADGGEFGMGAEIGIATGRFHARGPVGVEQLTIFKYVVRGNGQTRP